MAMNFDFDKEPNKKKFLKAIFQIFLFFIEAAVVIGIAYALVVYTVEQTDMLGSSMEQTLMDGDKILINKLAFVRNKPERYDVIVFKQSGDEHSFYDVKRIIGLPGETVQIIDGYVYIDGELLSEPLEVEPMHLSGFAEEPIVLDDDEYFVLGDNRNNSEDSRFANIGNIVYDDIIGTAWIRLNGLKIINSQKELEAKSQESTDQDATETDSTEQDVTEPESSE